MFQFWLYLDRMLGIFSVNNQLKVILATEKLIMLKVLSEQLFV